ncbi:hypothetical protein [Actinotalea fermentans]|uniref:Uncharacterized protein n=1 Tax=Actinotalea fermentans TaxID=43671 RepID=A0A511YY30_9CELL|nr:hypothetical protein [Actinotalea fermentans]GEN80102.1 hypothetical protein AFE02nite_18360 [Actinotalea fermentans]
MGGSRRLPWVLVALLLMVVTALVVVLVMRDDDAADDAPATSPPAETPSATATAEVEQAETGEGDEADEGDDDPSAGDLPLLDPGEHLPADGVSDIPAVGTDLVNGDYVAHVTDADLSTMVLGADVEVLYIGAAADEYLLEHDPTAEIPPPNGFVLVNDSTDVRQVPMADDVRIWDWCSGDDGQLTFLERTPMDWWLAPAPGSQQCSAGAGLGHAGNLYWLQVRDGEVKRLIGQYLP